MQNASDNTIDAAIAAAGSKATYTGATSAALGWLTSSEAGVVIGIALGVLGLMVNIVFRWREDRRNEREHLARLKAIEDGNL